MESETAKRFKVENGGRWTVERRRVAPAWVDWTARVVDSGIDEWRWTAKGESENGVEEEGLWNEEEDQNWAVTFYLSLITT